MLRQFRGERPMFGLQKKKKKKKRGRKEKKRVYTFVLPSVPEKEGTHAPGVGVGEGKDILL